MVSSSTRGCAKLRSRQGFACSCSSRARLGGSGPKRGSRKERSQEVSKAPKPTFIPAVRTQVARFPLRKPVKHQVNGRQGCQSAKGSLRTDVGPILGIVCSSLKAIETQLCHAASSSFGIPLRASEEHDTEIQD